jgi:hypothetical protein
MKLIKIQEFKSPEKNSVYLDRQKYCVTLGNNTKHYFTDKRKVSNFLATTNKFLNEQLQELNLYFADCFTLYRSAWLIYDNKNAADQQKIIINFNNLTKSFDSAVKYRIGYLGNFAAWNFLNNIIANILEITSTLLPLFTYRQYFDKCTQLKRMIKNINDIKENLKRYPETDFNFKEIIKNLL